MLKILVVRACAIGDFVLNLPALQSLQELNPDARISLVGYPRILELAHDFIEVAAIHNIEREPWNQLFYRTVNGLKFDMAIVWMKDETFARNLRLSGLDKVIRLDPFPDRTHAATHLLAGLSLNAPVLPDKWRPEARQIVLHPGSGSPSKCWPFFRELAARIEDPAFLIGPAETAFDTSGYPRIEVESLRDVAGLLRRSGGFIGNDSGITHLAAYLGCPAVAIFGPTDPGIWGPIGRRVRVIRKPDLRQLSVDEVASSCRDWFAFNASANPGFRE